jgi:hypothetical protein
MKHFSIALLTLVFALSSGSAFASLTQTEVSQLYIGVFGRASEGSVNAVYDVTFSDDTYFQGTGRANWTGRATWSDGYSSCSATSSISGTRF